MDKVRIGIVGVGNIGTAHANTIFAGKVAGATLGAICDISADRRQFCKDNYTGVEIFEDYKTMFASGLIDAVIVATPHKLHCDIAMDALKSELNVLVEKPVDITISKAMAINELVKETDKKFAIMFNQRTNDIFAKAREIVKSGALGELKRTVWIITNWYRTQRYYDSAGWRATWAGEGGGVLLNQAPHNLDLWQWICGMPVEVQANCEVGKYHNIEVEDDVTLLTRYENGATGMFITSTGEFPGTNRLEISGTKGKIVVESGTLKWWKLPEDERQICFNAEQLFPSIKCDYEEFVTQSKDGEAHMKIIQNYVNAILYDEELLSPGTDGIYELTLSNAAYLSSWKGGVPVKLPFNEREFDKELNKKIKNSKTNDPKENKNASGKYSKRWQVNW
ncbi:MAG: Gfo/Idh/MocA family oxidoreductase [Ruminococcaceae bacterium]|nr:Gfo/Idh/MocA family oxidoreductase [Oscillospiraceae bacterium]